MRNGIMRITEDQHFEVAKYSFRHSEVTYLCDSLSIDLIEKDAAWCQNSAQQPLLLCVCQRVTNIQSNFQTFLYGQWLLLAEQFRQLLQRKISENERTLQPSV